MTAPDRERLQRAYRIAESAARVSLREELEEWARSRNAILAQAAATELSRRRDLREKTQKGV